MGVVDTSSKFRRYHWHRWQICHQCQQHKQNWWQNLPLVLLIPVANLPLVSLSPAAILPLVSLTQVVHLILRGLGEGEVIHEKPEAKFSWHCPFKPGQEPCKTWIITQILLLNDTFEPYIWNQHIWLRKYKKSGKIEKKQKQAIPNVCSANLRPTQGLFSKNRKFC